ncbi:unnamed protein product [Ceratitis capitata]|uniref:(Mediterranean fruit fly) hypothetical protein n=1 Tax=Ceratitis capitata TaxID=7213 RepID=A0A811UY69_CERCA|nr:unnamed protein product [Ceratitis capitata]
MTLIQFVNSSLSRLPTTVAIDARTDPASAMYTRTHGLSNSSRRRRDSGLVGFAKLITAYSYYYPRLVQEYYVPQHHLGQYVPGLSNKQMLCTFVLAILQRSTEPKPKPNFSRKSFPKPV